MSAERCLRALFAVVLFVASAAAHALLPIQHWETRGGARVYFVENRELPMLDVSVEFPAGAAYDPREKSGLARLTNQLLQLGTRTLDEDAIARRTADVGAILGRRFDTDRAGVALRTLSSARERDQALSVLAAVLREPTFPAPVLAREKVRTIAGIREADTRPETIAAVNFFRLTFRDHPYGQRQSGEAATVEKLTRDDLADFYRRHYVARHAVIAIMGDVSRDEAARIAEELTAGLPAGREEAATLPPVPPLERSASRYVSHPSTQSHILVGAPGIRRGDPEFFPILVGNHVLGGGGFVSRLMDEVRQKRGLAYSAYSAFTPLQRPGPFVIGMQTRQDQTKQALEVVDATVRDFLANGPSDAELAAAKQNLTGSFPLRIDSNGAIHEQLALIGFYRLPLTYLDDWVKNVEAVTAAQVKAAFQRHFDAGRLVTVVVGADGERTAARER